MGWFIKKISPLYRKGVWGIGNTRSLSRYKKRSGKTTPFVGLRIEISNPFLEDYERVILFFKWINTNFPESL